jgi:hypothetical protein
MEVTAPQTENGITIRTLSDPKGLGCIIPELTLTLSTAGLTRESPENS